jgi:hypothetical protein
MRHFVVLLAALSLGSGLAACGSGSGGAQNRDGNPGVEDQKLDERRQPEAAPGGGSEPLPTTP